MHLTPGHTRELGAHVEAHGVNFALAAPNAQAVELCLFGADGSEQRCFMPVQTQGIWSGFLAGATEGQVFGWRVHGPWNPQGGARFNPAKLLLDPYARQVVGRFGGEDIHCGHSPDDPFQPDMRDNAALALKAVVVKPLPPAQRQVRVEPGRRVIYEVHTKGFTALHPDVPEHLRGSYAGLAHPAALAHFQRLGVTTLCLMPVAQRADETRLLRMGLRNYWGYSPVAWNAPEMHYWSGTPGTTPRTEFRQMVEAMHAAGLELILDVVYNHTAETDELGPTLSLRGIDNATYYHLDAHHPSRYLNVTGCGNTVSLNHPLVLRTVMDSLRMWVLEMGVDGFRFDLAPVLGRGSQKEGNAFNAQAPFLMAVAQDPVLRETLMVAEPWDIGHGGHQLGHFPSGWLEWNDRFRDDQRCFWLQERGNLGTLAHRMAGSADAFIPQRRSPGASVNFVTAHDGFTLTDLVSYLHRHNQANGEGNRDGHSHNMSVNHGVEGPSSDPAVQNARLRNKRVLLAMTVLSLGTPMLLAGDDLGHTQGGNNNAYCQDNATSWLNWNGADLALNTFVARLVQVRHARAALQSRHWWSAPDHGGPLVARWLRPDGQAMGHQGWHDAQQRALGLLLEPAGEAACLLLINGSSATVCFALPAGTWIRHLDTQTGSIADLALDPQEVAVPAGGLWLASTTTLHSH